MANCYFCQKPEREDGSTIHHPNCAGLERSEMNNLQVHDLNDRIAQLKQALAEDHGDPESYAELVPKILARGSTNDAATKQSD